MDDHRRKLLRSLGRARDSLLTSVEGLDERAATSEPVFGDWTVKDILGHLVTWGDELRLEIREILVDPTPRYSYVISSDRDYNAWNRSQVAMKQSLALQETLDGLERDYEESVDLVKRLAPDQLQRRGVVPWRIGQLPPPEEVTPETSMTIAGLVEIHIQHLEEHSAEIKRWRSQREKLAK